VPELKARFPDAPNIARPGNLNSWDNEDFKRTDFQSAGPLIKFDFPA
jgi:hypothetical protein